MKKVLLLLTMVALMGCSNNKIVGKWVSVSSKENALVSVGTVSRLTYNSDGTYEARFSFQAEAGGKSSDVVFAVFGSWEMPNDNTLIVHQKKSKIGNDEMESVKDVKYEVIELDDNNLLLMTGGKQYRFKRDK